jgi:hypothetical protein
VASFDDLDGLTCRVGTPEEGIIEVTYAAGGAVSLQCASAALFELGVTKTGTGVGTVSSSPAGINCGTDCSESYGSGTVVTLTATPGFQNHFAGWSGPCSGTATTCTVTMSEARTVTATFHGTANLTVYVQNTRGTFLATYGTNTVSGPNGFECTRSGDGTSVCSLQVIAGQSTTLTATADSGDRFYQWSGVCEGSSASTCTFTPAQGSRSVYATFDDH